MNDQALIHAVFPTSGNGPKRLARVLGVPVRTARHWYYEHLSNARRREIILALIDEMERRERHHAEIRRELQRIVGEYGEMGTGMAECCSALARVADALDAVADVVNATAGKLGATALRIAEKAEK